MLNTNLHAVVHLFEGLISVTVNNTISFLAASSEVAIT